MLKLDNEAPQGWTPISYPCSTVQVIPLSYISFKFTVIASNSYIASVLTKNLHLFLHVALHNLSWRRLIEAPSGQKGASSILVYRKRFGSVPDALTK